MRQRVSAEELGEPRLHGGAPCRVGGGLVGSEAWMCLRLQQPVVGLAESGLRVLANPNDP